MSLPAKLASSRVLGLDIGGANLKAATSDGQALSVPFALWREPEALAGRLRSILRQLRHERLAITMTAELCDCFDTKRDGVRAILNSVTHAAAAAVPIQVWSTDGRLLDVNEAHAQPLRVAAANWNALATFAGRFVPTGAALLVDIGSTTTDLIPLWQGRPVSRRFSDAERMRHGELCYLGVRRTPVCALLGQSSLDALGHAVAAEVFATMHDVYLVLGLTPEEPRNCETADGRPATQKDAHARLARLGCYDAYSFPWSRAVRFARQIFSVQSRVLAGHLDKVVKTLPERPKKIVVAGVGDFLLRKALVRHPARAPLVSLKKLLSPNVAAAACAYAVAVLAAEAK